jgi:hypothetical protein
MSQVNKLYKAMHEGRSVTRVTAMHMGVMNLTARITDLRNAGINVECVMKTDTDGNRYGSFQLAI